MRNAADAERHLDALEAAVQNRDHAGIVAMHAGLLAAELWDPYRGVREDWPAIYDLWLLLGEIYRLESFWHGTIAYTGNTGKREGLIGDVLRFASFGIWCEVWEQFSLRDAVRQWVQLEVDAMRGDLGPSSSMVCAFLAGNVPPDAAEEWFQIRKKYSRGGLQRLAVHNDSFPYDVLAPELAWCAKVGQTVPRCFAIVHFPRVSDQWPVSPMTERALMALAKTWH